MEEKPKHGPEDGLENGEKGKIRRVLFVCTGNTCRSPMAAALFNLMLARRGVTDVTGESAGLAAAAGESASRNAMLAAAEAGADLSAHRARQVTRRLVLESDHIYVMSPRHLAALTGAFPEAAGKTAVLGAGIPDPFGGDLPVYRAAREAIAKALGPVARDYGA